MTSMPIRWTVPPGNSGYVIPFDSTRGPHGMVQAAIAAGSAYLVPGPMRGKYAGFGYRITVYSSDQAVTLEEQCLMRNGNAAADWVTQGGAGVGSHTVASGVEFTGDFLPMGSDHRLLVTAGATAPTLLVVNVTLFRTADYGG